MENFDQLKNNTVVNTAVLGVVVPLQTVVIAVSATTGMVSFVSPTPLSHLTPQQLAPYVASLNGDITNQLSQQN